MANEVVPATGSFLDELNLPKIVAGPAGEAISRLIGGAVDIPAAWLAQVAQGIKDKTEAKTVVSKAVADAAASIAWNDPEVIQRAAHSLLAKELRHQTNREAIARKAIEYLADEPTEQTAKPDDDWLNVFERYAEDASSERLQDIWGRIFAGELRRAKTFSLRTLRFVSELDESVVNQFEKWSARVVDFDSIPFPPTQGVEFSELLHLQDCGLVTGVGSTLHKKFDLNKVPEGQRVPLRFGFRHFAVIVLIEPPFEFQIPNLFLTSIGREIYSITRTTTKLETVRAFVEQFPKNHVDQILIADLGNNNQTEICWSKSP
ncbi:DUF2806 domain-containing protein [Bradyrhizobium sp. Arg237L]|uniref:DUF2806 domain-containing protein n=1 Tax=Bradyrhizobium sp. Arg237L TaxID=3003352 RepID=UPI00249F7FF5|nr:DUF2806 domain-containing protein [Bradyrhizobium sp. Arg237L]MDI4236794.1 DUF2806 domain-containing protein [Bradyrhizobium sp. Arg237L]